MAEARNTVVTRPQLIDNQDVGCRLLFTSRDANDREVDSSSESSSDISRASSKYRDESGMSEASTSSLCLYPSSQEATVRIEALGSRRPRVYGQSRSFSEQQDSGSRASQLGVHDWRRGPGR